MSAPRLDTVPRCIFISSQHGRYRDTEEAALTQTLTRRRIGSTALTVTDIGFGTGGIGNLYRAVDAADADAVLQAAWQAGIRYFDTAPFYGFGLAERRLGDFLRHQPADGVVLSTKVGRILRPVPWDRIPDHGFVDPLPFAPEFDYSYDGIMRSFESSYMRLGLNRIDMAWVHDIGTLTHGEANRIHMDALFGGGLRALENLKASGAIAAYGLGVNEVAVCLEVMQRAKLDAILLAGRYTLLDRSAVAELLPVCERHDTSLVIGGVFNSGILATGAVAGAFFDYARAGANVVTRVDALAQVAARHGIPLAAAAMQFPLRHPAVASVLIGTGKAASLTRNLELLQVPVPGASWTEFDRCTIGGPAC